MSDLEHKGGLVSNRPLGSPELDKLLADCGPEAGQSLQLGCPQCRQTKLSVGYAQGVLVLACEPCSRQLALIKVAGAEHTMLAEIMAGLDEIRDLLEDEDK